MEGGQEEGIKTVTTRSAANTTVYARRVAALGGREEERSLGFNPYPYPRCTCSCPCPLTLRQERRKATDKKASRKTRKTRHRLRQRQEDLTQISLVPLCLVLPFKTALLLLPLPWLGDHSRVAIWTWRTSWRCVPVHEVSSLRVYPCHASCTYPRCRTHHCSNQRWWWGRSNVM